MWGETYRSSVRDEQVPNDQDQTRGHRESCASFSTAHSWHPMLMRQSEGEAANTSNCLLLYSFELSTAELPGSFRWSCEGRLGIRSTWTLSPNTEYYNGLAPSPHPATGKVSPMWLTMVIIITIITLSNYYFWISPIEALTLIIIGPYHCKWVSDNGRWQL